MTSNRTKTQLKHENSLNTDIYISESDAVHPRFNSEGVDLDEYQRKNDYYCVPCRIYFAPTSLGLREHFAPGRIAHTSTRKCIYCKGPVFEFQLDERVKFYHDCEEKRQ